MLGREEMSNTLRMVRLATLWLFVIYPSSLLADGQLPPPHWFEVCSPNQMFCAVSDPETNTTRLYESVPGDVLRERWAIPGWHRQLAVSDGGILVVGHDGLTFVPRSYSNDLPILSFHFSAERSARVTISEVLRFPSAMRRTVSHYRWGEYVGWDRRGNYRVATAEGRVLSFDPETGNLVSVSWTWALRIQVGLGLVGVVALLAVVSGFVSRRRRRAQLPWARLVDRTNGNERGPDPGSQRNRIRGLRIRGLRGTGSL
jgi:hypothetical protein